MTRGPEAFSRLARRALRFAATRLAQWAPRQRALAGTLRSAPIDTEPAAAGNPALPLIGIHVLSNDAYLLPAIWSLKSFLLAANQPLPITVHLQGNHVRNTLDTFPAISLKRA